MGWVGWGGVVDTDALLSSSPSLIWLQLGFGLARAVTIRDFAARMEYWQSCRVYVLYVD